MKKTKLSRTSSLILLAIISCGALVTFQNCSVNSSGGGVRIPVTSYILPTEVNTTKAVGIRFETLSKSLNSGEPIEIVAHAEDENGDIVTDFNYSGLVVKQSASDSLVTVCAPTTKFVNGQLRTTVSILNNHTTSVNLTLEVKSTVPVASLLTLTIAGQAEDTFKNINTFGTIPPPRSRATAIYDSVKNRILLFGGREVLEAYNDLEDGAPLNDIWELKLAGDRPEWNNITPANSPTPRYGHTLVLDSTQNRALLFGGADSTSLVSNDIWSFDLQTDSWSVLAANNAPPRQRINHSSLYEASSKTLYIWGGSGFDQTSHYFDSSALKLGGQNPNWMGPSTSFSTTVSPTVTAVYDNLNVTFYNPFFPEKPLSTDINYCTYPGRLYGCASGGYSVALDTKQKAQWLVGTLTTLTPAETYVYYGSLKYSPILKVFKRNLPIKQTCGN